MACDLTQTLLHGYLDGELDAVRAQEFERHLESCAQCVEQLEAQEAMRSRLQAGKLYEAAPRQLAVRLRAELAGTREKKSWGSLRLWKWATATAVAAALVLAVIAATNLRSGRGEDALVAEALDAHVRALQPGHLTDVLSTDQHTVKPWFDGKLDYVPPVKNFSESGFPLVGARLDVLQGKSVATLVYGRRKHYISLFVWVPKSGEAEPARSGSRNGYQWVYWSAQGMEFCAVSDVSAGDLQNLAELMRE